MGENIGAVARAMSNFGLSELRLVAPRDGWPNQRALETSSGATSIIEAAKVFPDFASAVADIQIAYATTARPRDMSKRVVTPEVAAREIAQRSDVRYQMLEKDTSLTSNIRHLTSAMPCIALVFGPERTGLENEEIGWCDTLITIPTAPEKSSLNLAQSVVVVGYEWWKAQSAFQISDVRDQILERNTSLTSNIQHLTSGGIAAKSDWQGLFDQLDGYLDDINYYRVEGKKTVMWMNMRNMLLRGGWSDQEVRTFRGMLRGLWERKRKGG